MKHSSIRILSFFLLATFLLFGCQKLEIPDSPFPISDDRISLDTLATGFTIPYGVAIVGEDEYFISDRIGKFFHYQSGELTEIEGMPKVNTFKQPGLAWILHGGLMDVSVHPNYPATPWIYIAYLSEDKVGTVGRFQLEENRAVLCETIFETSNSGRYGNGMRIVWEDDTHFFLNVGGTTLSTKEDPQLVAQGFYKDWGKIHRIMEDGSIPSDNPSLPGLGYHTTVWSYGHRDAQGLFYDAADHTLFACEHGPKGGDEFNVVEKGGNYGWPLFTYGIDYSGVDVSLISEDSAATFTILPEHYWTVWTDEGRQSIAPSCLFKAEDSNLPEWNGQFLIGSLVFRRLLMFDRDTGETTGLPVTGRVRTVKQLPGGDLLALIERNQLGKANGVLVRIGGM